MGYAVLHLDKASGNEAKMTAHIERTQMPKNADSERTHLNRELIEFPKGVNSRTEAIQHRINNAGLTRKIGTNQVRAIRIMLTGSHEDMKRIEAEGRLDEWCNNNLDWLRKTYGADNLVSAVLHLDEATPHIHATVVPIVTGERRKVKEQKKKDDEPGKKKYRKKNTNAARLCANDVMTRIKPKEYQDSLYEKKFKENNSFLYYISIGHDDATLNNGNFKIIISNLISFGNSISEMQNISQFYSPV